MLFMVIERFRNQDAKAVYKRLEEAGRMAPDGLEYKESWVEADFGRCFQLMECDDIALLQQWVANWQDLVKFEVVPVLEAQDTEEAIFSTFD